MHSVPQQIFMDHLGHGKHWGGSTGGTVWDGESVLEKKNSFCQPLLENCVTWVNCITSLFILLPDHCYNKISLDKKVLPEAKRLKMQLLIQTDYVIYLTVPNWSLILSSGIILGEMAFITMFPGSLGQWNTFYYWESNRVNILSSLFILTSLNLNGLFWRLTLLCVWWTASCIIGSQKTTADSSCC